MDPYLHAAAGRGESFRIDDIDSLDVLAANGAQVQRTVPWPVAGIRWLKLLLKQIRQSNHTLLQKGEE